MPNKNGTGPAGKGPRTGKGLGKCKPVVKKSPKKISTKVKIKPKPKKK